MMNNTGKVNLFKFFKLYTQQGFWGSFRDCSEAVEYAELLIKDGNDPQWVRIIFNDTDLVWVNGKYIEG